MRLYSEKEVGKLIQRATEIQQGKSDASARGLSLQEIEKIAADMGLDPEQLRLAASEMDNDLVTDSATNFWGAPFKVDVNRVVEGGLNDEQWEEIVLMLRNVTNTSGRTSSIGKTKEWSHFLDEGLGFTRVSISPRVDQSTIRVQKQFHGAAILTYIFAAVLGIAAPLVLSELSGVVISKVLGFSLLGAGLVSSLLAARASITSWVKFQRKKLNRILKKTMGILEEPAAIRETPVRVIEIPEPSESVDSATRVRNNDVRA